MLGAQSQRSVSAIGLGLLLFCFISETSASRISLICSPYATSECLTATAEIQRVISTRPTGATVSFASINYTLPNAVGNITDLSTSQSAADTTLAISLLCSDAISLALSTATNVMFVDACTESRAWGRTLLPQELGLNSPTNARIEAAFAFLSTYNWNATSIVLGAEDRGLVTVLEAAAASRGVEITSQSVIVSGVPSTASQAVGQVVLAKSNIVMVVSSLEILRAFENSLVDQTLEIIWVPTSVFDSAVLKNISTLLSYDVTLKGVFVVQEATAEQRLYSLAQEWITRAETAPDAASLLNSFRGTSFRSANNITSLTWNSDLDLIGDVALVNVRQADAATVARWTTSGVSNIATAMFASGTQALPSIHSPVFLLGLNFDTLICCGHNEWVEVSRMAIADIRESNFIPGVEFRSLYLTDDYSVRGGVSAAVTLAEQKVNAIVGGSASFIAIASLNYLTEFGMPYISPAATSDALSDKDSFPTFMRTVGPDRIQARVLADLATFYKWKKICSINFEADYESNLITRFGNALAEGSTLTRSTYTGKEDVPTSLEKLAQAKCKIIFAAMDYVNFGSIINEAKKQGLLGVGVQWIMTDALYSEFTEDRLLNTHKIAPADIKGTLLVTPSQGPAGSPFLERFFTLLARERAVNQTATVDTYSTFVYDAIWGIARAVKSLNAKRALGFTNSTALLQELLDITYEGASGIVSFDEKGDRENMPYSIFNWNAGTSDPFRSVGSWEGQIVINQSKIIFSDGTSNAVLDSVPTPIETLWYSTTIGGIVTAISVVLLVLMCITVVLLIIHRQNRLIIASSPVFLGFILGGCMLAIMSNFFWFGEPSVAKCYFRTWFGFLGFALSTGSLLAKNGRLWYLFNQKTLRAVAITNQQLAIYLFVVVAPQVILLILWSAISPFQIQNVVNVTQTSSLRLCISDSDKIFLPISIAYMGLLFVTGAFMSFKTRKLPQIFRESQWIALINYNYLFVATIAIAVSYGIQTEPLIGIGITTLAVLFAAGVNWALIFITKFYLIIFRPEAVSDMKTTTASVTRSVNAMSVMKKVSAASTTESD